MAEERGAQEVVFDNSLTPSQVRNLGKELELTVIDRTNLILDIFAIRAQTREAKLQVETARLQYMLPRLVGMYDALSRLGGASGSMSNKGTGEKKLELDRRKIEHRITELKKELEDVSRTRDVQRRKRQQSRTPQVALVGFEDMMHVNLTSPSFTYVSSASEETGRQVASLIIRKIKEPALPTQRITLSGQLVARESA